MKHEKDLAKPTKKGLETLQKAYILLNYLYSGNTYYYDGRYYRMDGDFNPYLVSLKEDYKTPVGKGEESMPIFQNQEFWNILIDMASSIDNETLQKISMDNAIIKVLNHV